MLKSASVPINWWVFERIDHSKEHFFGLQAAIAFEARTRCIQFECKH